MSWVGLQCVIVVFPVHTHLLSEYLEIITCETPIYTKDHPKLMESNQIEEFFVCGRVPWLYQYWPGGFMLFVVLCPGTSKGSTGSGSGFKASQKTGQRLKVSSDRLGEAGN